MTNKLVVVIRLKYQKLRKCYHMKLNFLYKITAASSILISLKIAEFRTPPPQDIRKKGSKILKLPRFAIVLHKQ